jgi:hypothetical protein
MADTTISQNIDPSYLIILYNTAKIDHSTTQTFRRNCLEK